MDTIIRGRYLRREIRKKQERKKNGTSHTCQSKSLTIGKELMSRLARGKSDPKAQIKKLILSSHSFNIPHDLT